MITRRSFVFTATALLLRPDLAAARRADAARVSVVAFDLIRPSQAAVGYREVAEKRAEVESLLRKPEKLARYLAKEALPVVQGPGGTLHLVDHHHLGRALWDLGRRDVQVETIADLSNLTPAAFWAEMSRRGWLYAFDAQGQTIEPARLPQHIRDMADDVYRSLAGAVRKAGGYTKTQTPFAEFKWADFFRSRITRSVVEKDFASAVAQGLRLAATPDARDLPGFVGVRRKAA